MVAAFAVGKTDPAFAMQTVDLNMMPDTAGETKLEELCEHEILYSRGAEVRTFTDEYGKTYQGDIYGSGTIFCFLDFMTVKFFETVFLLRFFENSGAF